MTEIQPIDKLRACLARHSAARTEPPFTPPLAINPWQAMSLLQKAVRRGQLDLALGATSTLLDLAPDRFWRRAGVIVFEDIGVADLPTVGLVTASLGGKRIRSCLGGEWAVASLIVERMVAAPKNRAADDLFAVLESWPGLTDQRRSFARMSNHQLRVIALGTDPLPVRALALWYLFGTDRVASKSLTMRRGNPVLGFDLLDELGVSPSMLAIAKEGFRRTGELLCPLVALLSLENGLREGTVDDRMPPVAMIGPLPSFALDMFTREGRAALGKLLSGDATIAGWAKANLPVVGRTEFLAQLLFRLESGLLLRRRDGELGHELRRLMDTECLGLPPDKATKALCLMRDCLPRLNELRRGVMGEISHVE